MNIINNIWSGLSNSLSADILRILLDIIIITFLAYTVITWVVSSGTFQVLKGITILLITSLLASMLRLTALQAIMENILQIGVFAVLIIFQPELRRAIEEFGKTDFFTGGIFNAKSSKEQEILMLNKTIADVCDAVERMSKKKTGALIVFERKVDLEQVAKTGTTINADATVELLGTIFYNGTPLHDGAVVIRHGKVASAGCFLPLSANLEISKDLGTRHRAALGMCEKSDAIVVVCSEETGDVRVAKNGVLFKREDRQSLYNLLVEELIPKTTEKKRKTNHSGSL